MYLSVTQGYITKLFLQLVNFLYFAVGVLYCLLNHAFHRRVGELHAEFLQMSVVSNNVLSDIKWEFYLVQSKQANAFCLPDGKVVFYEGIMPVLTTPDMIAVVMSHEMGHAIARHGNERMTQQTLTNLVGAVTGQIIEQKTSENGRAIFETAYTIGSQYGYLLPYSRKHELEADEIGLYIMAIAGFDINQAPLLWQRMADAGTTQVPEALSTHPSDERRMKNLQKLIEKARKFAAEVR